MILATLVTEIWNLPNMFLTQGTFDLKADN